MIKRNNSDNKINEEIIINNKKYNKRSMIIIQKSNLFSSTLQTKIPKRFEFFASNYEIWDTSVLYITPLYRGQETRWAHLIVKFPNLNFKGIFFGKKQVCEIRKFLEMEIECFTKLRCVLDFLVIMAFLIRMFNLIIMS